MNPLNFLKALKEKRVQAMVDKEDISGLINQLRDYTDARLIAKFTLARIGTPVVEPLIKALRNRNSNIRKGAAEVLCDIGGTRAVEALMEALKNGYLDELPYTAWKLRDTAVPSLIELLNDKSSRVRNEAAKALGNIGNTQAVKPLIDALNEGRLSDLPYRVFRDMGTAAVEPLIELLSHEKTRVRTVAASQLGDIGDVRAVAPLIEALIDERLSAYETAYPLHNIGARAGEALDQALQTLPVEIRQKVSRAFRANDATTLGRALESAHAGMLREIPQTPALEAVRCGKCKHGFMWEQSYHSRVTTSSESYNPPGHGNFRPRAFCPHCGYLVAEWDIDQSEDRNRWKWYGENAQLNADVSLPPDPLLFWGMEELPDQLVSMDKEYIDIQHVRQILGSSIKIVPTENLQEKLHPSDEVISGMTDGQMVQILESLCRAYGAYDKAAIAILEPKATSIGQELNQRGGLEEMKRVYYLLPPQQGLRTLEMHWNGIGEWRG
jgi:hypothetical protein